MSMFDADAFIEAHAVPSIKINGKIHEGKILSLPEYLPFFEKIIGFWELDEKDLDDIEKINAVVELEKTKRAFMRKTFPRKLKYRIFLDPIEYIYKLPKAAQEEAFNRFFVQTGEAHALLRKNPTNGTSSQKKESQSPRKRKK